MIIGCGRMGLAAAALLLASVHAGEASDPVLARSGTISITASGLADLVASLPAESRPQVAGDPAALAELLRAAMVQAKLLALAHAAGWDRRPEVVALAQRAHDAAIVHGFVLSQAGPASAPTDEALRSAYEANKMHFMQPRTYHLAQIFLSLPPHADASLIERRRTDLAALRRRLIARPEDFAATAQRGSEDTRSAAAGGDLGWVREDALTQPIAAAVAGLPEGSLSDPIRSPDGWHLIRLIATRPAGPTPLGEARPAIVRALQAQQQQAAARRYADALLTLEPVQIDQSRLTRFAKPGATP